MSRLLATVVVVVALLASSCGSNTTTETAGPGATPTSTQTTSKTATFDTAPSCAGDDWVAVDVGPFGFSTPSDLVDEEVQGIDSLVGRYVGGGLVVSFDYGWYSPGLDEVERLGATVGPVELGDRSGFFGTAAGARAEYGSEYLTHLRVEDVPGDDPSNALWMGIAYDDEELIPTAECIVSTVRLA